MNLWLIPVLPLLGFLINGLFGRRFPKQIVNVVAIGSVMLSFPVGGEDIWAFIPLDTAPSNTTTPGSKAAPLTSASILPSTGSPR